MAILLCVHHLPCLQIFLFYNPKVLHFCTDSLQLSRWVGLWNSQSHHQGPRCSYMLVQLCAKGTYLLSPKIPLKKNKIAKAGARRPQREPAATSCQLLKLHMSLGLKGFERDTALRLSDRRHFTQDLVTLHPSAAAACYGFCTRICKAFSMLFQRSFSLSHFKQFGLFRTSLAQHPPETPLCTPALLAF